ncbi:hypothetical protein M2150_001707 [Lachnospiraceae bacterium PM6-15]|uniref:hypothetical protein n=1 Tax=Ohessyouella blattaphilus TaxID=2949333 RepID=UPI003E1A5F1D
MQNEMIVNFYRENNTYFTDKKVLSFSDKGTLFDAFLTEISRTGDCFFEISNEEAPTNKFEYLANINLSEVGNIKLCELEDKISNYINLEDLRIYINGEERKNMTKLVSYDWLDKTLPIFCYVDSPEAPETVRLARGMSGYHHLPEPHRHTPAQKLNAELGVTESEAKAMLEGSMYGWERERLEPLLKKEKRGLFGRKKR